MNGSIACTVLRWPAQGRAQAARPYRQGLGRHLRRVSDDIIDGEFSETKQEAPSIAGPGDGAQ